MYIINAVIQTQDSKDHSSPKTTPPIRINLGYVGQKFRVFSMLFSIMFRGNTLPVFDDGDNDPPKVL